ncbi:MAG: ATP-binding protein [Flavobacteriales bacterium]|nr:HAMP domain-containing protein [Flavobacteriales bacterium]
MNIRTRLAVQFLLLASCILGLAFVIVYLRAAEFRKDEFNTRLHDRGENAANLLIQVEEVDDRLLRKMEQRGLVRLTEESISIFDSNDSLLFHMGIEDPMEPKYMITRIKEKGTLLSAFNDREAFGSVFMNGDEQYTVVTSGYDRFGRRKLADLARVMLVTLVIGTALIFLVGRIFALRALSPIKRLVEDIQETSATDLSKRVDIGNGTDELAQLAISFNGMLGRLRSAFHSQKNFIANASHEMRTPLTAISGQIDVLLLKPRSEADYLKALRSIQEDVRAVTRSSDRLLLLAQAETEATAISFSPVRLDEVIWMVRENLMEANVANKIDVNMNEVEDDEDVTMTGNEILLQSMIANLLENACKYSPDHHAMISLGRVGSTIEMKVEDNGPGIAPQDQERIFEHFYRAKHTSDAHGYGIGLALVKRVVELHKGTIDVVSEIGKGAQFIVKFSSGS